MSRQLYRWNRETQAMDLVYDSERKVVNAPYVIQDTLNHPEECLTGSGFISDSKSRLKEMRKNAGIEVTRGNSITRKSVFESPEYLERQAEAERIEDTTKAYYDVKYAKGEAQYTELQKEIFKRENEKCQQYNRRMRGY